jgi:hypothetical protein
MSGAEPSTATPAGAIELARRIREREVSARATIERTLADIAQRNPDSNAFTLVTGARACPGRLIDNAIAEGRTLPPLAGCLAVKNLLTSPARSPRQARGSTARCRGRRRCGAGRAPDPGGRSAGRRAEHG